MRLVLVLLALAGCHDFDGFEACSNGVCTIGPQCFTSIHNGWAHACVLAKSGEVSCWGNNLAGQVGIPGTDNSTVPVPVIGLSGVHQLSAGDSATCAVSDGHVHCWGACANGQRGDGTICDGNPSPSTVSKLSDASAVTVGRTHVCAVRAAGTVACWGLDDHGQVGEPTLTEQDTPFDVPDLMGIVELALGFSHTCALDGSGRVFCWGDDSYGQLGDGGSVDQVVPTRAKVDDVAHIAAGFHHTCAVRLDGTAWCWGENSVGQLGNGSTMNSSLPVQAGDLSDLTGISVSGYATIGEVGHTCARGSTGTVWCWGDNMFGELGNASTQEEHAPIEVPGVHDALEVSSGAKDSCVRRGDSTVWCWGANDSGELGNGGTGESHVPVPSLLACP